MVYLESTQAHFFYRQLIRNPKAAPGTTDLSGQTGIVTGSNTGLGFEAARQLLGFKLSHLIIAVRDEAKGAAARDKLLQEHRSAQIEVWSLDMVSYDSVIAFAKRCETLPRIDFAILNAGVLKLEFETVPETGNEETLQVNYLSTTLLSILLIPILQKSPTLSHLTIVGSDVAEWSAFKEQNSVSILSAFNDPKLFGGMGDRYQTSKCILLLGFRELVAKIPYNEETKLIFNMVTPGLCRGSELSRDASGIAGSLFSVLKGAIGRTIEVGGYTLVDAAIVKGKESHGMFLGDNIIKPNYLPNYRTKKGLEVQRKLWAETVAELSKAAPVEQILTSMQSAKV